MTLVRLFKHMPIFFRHPLERFLEPGRLILLSDTNGVYVYDFSDEDEMDPAGVFSESVASKVLGFFV